MARPRSLQVPTAYSGNANAALAPVGAGIAAVNPLEGAAYVASVLEGNAEQTRKFEAEQNRRADNLRIAKAQRDFEFEAAKQAEELDPLAPDYEDQVHQIYTQEGGLAGQAAGFATGEGQSAYAIGVADAAGKARIGAYQRKHKAVIADALGQRDILENEARNRLRENPDSPDEALADFHAQADRLNSLLPPEIVAEADRKFNAALVYDRAEGLAEAGRADEARAFLDGPDAAGVDPASIRSAKRRVNEVENQVRLDRLRDTADQVGELRYKVGTGEWGRDEVLAADKTGLFKDREGEKWSLLAAVDATQKAAVSLARKKTAAMEKYSNSAGLDTQDEADLVYEEAAKDFDGETQTPQSFAAEFVNSTGFVPGPIKDILDKGGRPSTNPEALAQAGAIHEAIVARTGGVPGLKVAPSVVMTAKLIDAGVPAQEAAAEVQEMVRAGNGQVERLEKSFREETKDKDWADDLADRLDLDIDLIKTDPDLLDDYKNLTEFYYTRNNGNAELAGAAAAEQITLNRGASSMFGDEERLSEGDPVTVMKSRVRADYFTKPEIQEYLESKVKEDLGTLGVAPAGGWGVSEGGVPPVKLEYTKRTKDDLAHGRPPRYRIMVRTDYDAYRPIESTDPRNPYLEFTLPTSTEFMVDTGGLAQERRRRLQATGDRGLAAAMQRDRAKRGKNSIPGDSIAPVPVEDPLSGIVGGP